MTSRLGVKKRHATNTHHYDRNLIWRSVSSQVVEVIPSDHPRRETSRAIKWYDLIYET